MLGNTATPNLLYADDLVLLSGTGCPTHKKAERLMDALQAFCQSRRLTVNIGITKAIVFSCISTGLILTYQGQHIDHVQDLGYRCLDLHQGKLVTYCTSRLLAAAEKALFGLRRRCMGLYITDARL